MRSARLLTTVALVLATLPCAAAITGTVMTPDGQPIAGARVSIIATETPEARRTRLLTPTPDGVAIATAQTDAKGSFSLASPQEPVVTLKVDGAGLEPVMRRVERDEELGAIAVSKREMKKGVITAAGKPVANATVVVSYGGAEHVARTDEQGRYEAPEPKRSNAIAVIHPDFVLDEKLFFGPTASANDLNRSLTAGAQLKGKVVSADGKSPVANATIFADAWPVATTKEDGTFTIAHASPKWTMLVARKDSLVGHRALPDQQLTVRVEKAATIAGRVTDNKSKLPVPGAVVRAMSSGRRMAGDPGVSAVTDAKGAYSLIVPAGTFNVIASHPGYAFADADASVTAGQQVVKDLAMQQYARVTGVVLDEERRPVIAASIGTDDADSGMGRMPMRMMSGGTSAVSGSDGRFSIRVRPDANLRLRASKKGLPLVRGDAFQLTAGERKSGVVLTIPTGVAVTGIVKDGNGEPLSGVAVTASETPTGQRGMVMQRVIMMGGPMGDEDEVVRTATDGSFTLRVKEGTYDFNFRREGFAPKAVRAQNIATNGTNTVETTLEPAAEISGRVTRGGVGVPDVSISSMMGGGEGNAITGPDGSFQITGLAPGSIRLMIRKENELLSEQRTITAPARDVAIELPVGGTISGRIVEKGSRKPVTSFRAGVSVSRSGGGMMMMAPPVMKEFTTDDGSFTLQHVPLGAVNLVASAPGFAAGRMNLDLQEGKPITDLVLELETGVRLVGKVTGPNGSPLADATVMVAPSPTGSFAMSGTMRRATTDANGEYSLESLEAGEETIEFQHPKQVATSRTVTLKGRETRLDVQLSGGQRVTGTVVTESGMAVPDASVEAFSPSGGGDRTRTNASGTFEFESMSPGRYRFRAEKSGYLEARLDDVDVTTTNNVRLQLRSGGTIYGRVTGLTEADYASVIVDARGGGSTSSAAVDPSGNFRIEGAPVGTVSVSAMLSSRSFGTRRSSATQTVELNAGSSQQVTIEFRGDTSVRGRITRNGTPLRGATVAFYPRQGGSQTSASVTADEQGVYQVSGLESGEYTVMVVDSQRFSPYSTTYNVRGGGTFDIDFKAASIRGRVVNAGTNEPIADASVQFRPAQVTLGNNMPRSAVTDPSGGFAIDFVPPGSYVVTASREGFGNQVLDLQVGDGGRDDIELKLNRNDGVTLKVVDGRDGRALSAMLVVFDMQGRVVHENRMYFRGTDAVSDTKVPLSPGQYIATVSSMGYAPRTATFSSPSSQTVSLTPGGTIRVRSKHSTRRRMRLHDASGMHYPRFSPRPLPYDLPPGTIPFEHIAPGAYTLQLLNDDESVASTTQVIVREGEVVEVEL
jgi:large repetitive protein